MDTKPRLCENKTDDKIYAYYKLVTGVDGEGKPEFSGKLGEWVRPGEQIVLQNFGPRERYLASGENSGLTPIDPKFKKDNFGKLTFTEIEVQNAEIAERKAKAEEKKLAGSVPEYTGREPVRRAEPEEEPEKPQKMKPVSKKKR